MLRARLKDTIDSPGISAVLVIAESERLILAKTNGDIEVYSRENSKFKLFQTYPNILQNLHIDNPQIIDLFYADQLSTIFIQCRNVIVLLNSFNLHVYDRIVDQRGISSCWLLNTVIEGQSRTNDDSSLETEIPSDVESDPDKTTTTFLLYSTSKKSRLRLLVWKGRFYKTMVEINLPHSGEFVKSANSISIGIVITTNNGIYLWSYGRRILVKIQKVVERKYPKDLVSAIVDLNSQCNVGYFKDADPKIPSSEHKFPGNNDQAFSSQRSQISTRASISNFWRKNLITDEGHYKNIRYSFTPSKQTLFILDGATENLFELHGESSDDLSLLGKNQKQFFEWNAHFENMEYLSTDILMLYNSREIRFVDFQNGFTFLQEIIPEGVKCVKKTRGTYFIVWTNDDLIQLYHYQVDDGIKSSGVTSSTSSCNGYDDYNGDDVSICGKLQNSDFYLLWKKVLFYQFFLKSPFSVELCASPDPQESLDICAMKLRDFTVLWCLKIFNSLEKCMNIIHTDKQKSDSRNRKLKIDNQTFDQDYVERLQEIIVKDIFLYFIDVWAPPQLVILNTFPPSMSQLVNKLTGEEHECVDERANLEFKNTLILPPKLFKKYCIPYLTDIRRNLNNLLKTVDGGIQWHYYCRVITQKLDFFLLNNHSTLTIHEMLTMIDTVLFKAYFTYIPTMVGPLVRVPNMCDHNIVVHDLKAKHMHQELVDFYYQRGLHADALTYLISLTEKDGNDINKDKIKNMVKVLVIKYLQSMSDEFILEIFHYTEWLIEVFGLNKEAKLAILKDIFLTDSSNIARNEHIKIYNYLKKHDEILSLNYLELVISRQKKVNNELFLELCDRYLKNICNLQIRRKLRSVLESTLTYGYEELIKLFDRFIDDNVDREIQPTTEERRFIKFMKTYPLSHLGMHEKSIDILFSEISDYRKASNYCEKLFETDKSRGKEIIMYLFDKLINQYTENFEQGPNRNTHNDTSILTFLKDHSSKLDYLVLLKRIPDSLSIHNMNTILIDLIMSNTLKKEDYHMRKNLLQVELINSTYELNHDLSHFITISENYTCLICNKLISTFTSEEIKWYNFDNKDFIVHYNCGKTLEGRLIPKKFDTNSEKASRPRTVKEMKEIE